MLKLVRFGEATEKNVVQMKDMKPLQVGVVVDRGMYEGTVVMCTATSGKQEVMNLSDPGKDRCWTGGVCPFLVRLLPPGEKVVVELFNE